MKRLFLLLCCFCSYVIATATPAQTGELVYAKDFGVRSNSFENASAGLAKALAWCKGKRNATLVLPGGRLDAWPEGAETRELYISNGTEDDTLSKQHAIALLCEDMDGLTIEGNNTLIVLHGKMISFALLHSRRTTLLRLRFDYERPTMSEMTIESASDKSVVAAIHPDSRYYIDGQGQLTWYGEGWKSKSHHTVVFDPAWETMRYGQFTPFQQSKATSVGPLRVRFDGDFSKTSLKPGHVLTIRDPYRDNVGGFIFRSQDTKLYDIAMQYMHGLGIVSQFSENVHLVKVKAAPAAGSGRVISSFADCFHFSGCRGDLLIDSCLTAGSQDDPVNVHGTHLKITSMEGNKVTVRFMHHQTYGFEAFMVGDSVALVNPQTLLATGRSVVKQARLLSRREMELELEVPRGNAWKVGDCIENLTWTPSLIIRNSRFERTNTRGLLVTTRRKVLIENNVFFRTGMHAILIADDAASWFESGPVEDVTIRHNQFIECGYNSAPDNYVINVAPENHTAEKGRYVHRNIRITDNVFKVYDTPLLSAKSVDGLVFSNNRIEPSALLPGKAEKPSLRLIDCVRVTVRDNQLLTGWKPTLHLQGTDKKAIKTDWPIQVSAPVAR